MVQLQGLGQIALTVSDVEASTKFYRDVLSLPFLFAAGPSLAFFDLGSVRLMLTAPENGSTLQNSVLYYRCSNLDAAYQALVGSAEVIDAPHLIAKMPDHELWMFFIRDPDGNLIGLMEERRT